MSTYLVESVFLNTVTYENERLGAYLRKLAQAPADESGDLDEGAGR